MLLEVTKIRNLGKVQGDILECMWIIETLEGEYLDITKHSITKGCAQETIVIPNMKP